jgi:5'-3' exonuclease
MISNLMVQLGNHRNAKVDEGMIRHMILNTVRKYNKMFRKDYGDIIICADGPGYWRKDVFPLYKANRKESRDKDELDWPTIMRALHNIRDEIGQNLPYKTLLVDKAEADDIIGTLCHTYGNVMNTGEPILILSGDKDYIQLHTYGNVRQYNPRTDEYVTHNDPETYLYEHIMKGDSGDGVPNVLSADDALVMKIRQKPITQKRLAAWQDPANVDEATAKRIERNRQLIDLREVPEELQSKILDQYDNVNVPSRKNLYPYLVKKGLRNLLENIGEF